MRQTLHKTTLVPTHEIIFVIGKYHILALNMDASVGLTNGAIETLVHNEQNEIALLIFADNGSGIAN